MKIRFRSHTNFNAVKIAMEKGNEAALRSSGAYLRKVARNSIKISEQSSAPGQIPHSRRGRLKNAILFAVSPGKTSVIIGPTAASVGKTGYYHEFGGVQIKKSKRRQYRVGKPGPIKIDGNKVQWAILRNDKMLARAIDLDRAAWSDSSLVKQRRYPQRPLMRPALDKSLGRLPGFWENSIKS